MSRNKAFGRRVVQELLDSKLVVQEILYSNSIRGHDLDDIIASAKDQGIRIAPVSRQELDRMAPDENHQGIIAFFEGVKVISLEEVISDLDNENPAPIIILDGVEDPHNLGAIIRSAEVFGACAVIIRSRRSASLTPATIKASAGAALRLPVAVVPNIDRAIRSLKDAGVWIYGFILETEESIWQADITGNVGLVLGSEGKGISRLVRERCDRLLKIPQRGEVGSLNVSVSAGIVLAEWSRQSFS